MALNDNHSWNHMRRVGDYASAVTDRDDWITETTAALARAGYRSGGARRAVIELLGRQDCCLSAQEIFDLLRADGRAVGIASVYRVLELLSDKGFVQRLDVGGGTARFERVHRSGEHHHHL